MWRSRASHGEVPERSEGKWRIARDSEAMAKSPKVSCEWDEVRVLLFYLQKFENLAIGFIEGFKLNKSCASVRAVSGNCEHFGT
jgi:hypothetical protein